MGGSSKLCLNALKCLSIFALKLSRLSASTISAGSLFQCSTILWLKKCCRCVVLHLCFWSFKECPLVLSVESMLNICSETVYMSCTIDGFALSIDRVAPSMDPLIVQQSIDCATIGRLCCTNNRSRYLLLSSVTSPCPLKYYFIIVYEGKKKPIETGRACPCSPRSMFPHVSVTQSCHLTNPNSIPNLIPKT